MDAGYNVDDTEEEDDVDDDDVDDDEEEDVVYGGDEEEGDEGGGICDGTIFKKLWPQHTVILFRVMNVVSV